MKLKINYYTPSYHSLNILWSKKQKENVDVLEVCFNKDRLDLIPTISLNNPTVKKYFYYQEGGKKKIFKLKLLNFNSKYVFDITVFQWIPINLRGEIVQLIYSKFKYKDLSKLPDQIKKIGMLLD